MDVLLALSPLLLLVGLLLLHVELWKVSGITLMYSIALSLVHWGMSPLAALGAHGKGLFVAIDIFLILFGALLFLAYLEQSKKLDRIKNYIVSISPDRRVQVILLVWFFGSFIEGAAGFGTPAAIIAPLLISIGFPKLQAIAAALIGNSAAVVFGAVGTPVSVGLAGLPVAGIAPQIAGYNFFIGSIVPLLILSVIIRNKKEFIQSIPFALSSGVLLMGISYMVSLLGSEFPSLLGPLIAGGIMIILLDAGVFFKREKKKHEPFPLRAFLPYLLLIFWLLLGKFQPVGINVPLGSNIGHSFSLSNPGIAFFLSIGVFLLLEHNTYGLRAKGKELAKKLLLPTLVIFFITSIVQLMIHTNTNTTGMQSMLELLGGAMGTYLAFFTPTLGVFGAFMTGSATVASLLFGSLVYQGGGLLALLVIGAGIGNMISLTNIIAVQAAVGEHGQELAILKLTLPACLILLVLATLLGLIA